MICIWKSFDYTNNFTYYYITTTNTYKAQSSIAQSAAGAGVPRLQFSSALALGRQREAQAKIILNVDRAQALHERGVVLEHANEVSLAKRKLRLVRGVILAAESALPDGGVGMRRDAMRGVVRNAPPEPLKVDGRVGQPDLEVERRALLVPDEGGHQHVINMQSHRHLIGASSAPRTRS
jgi:hypothetical protein